MKLFYSYSSQDEKVRRELETHLALLKRDGTLETWSFRDIDAGEQWEQKIDRRLEEADVILLLVTAQFLSSRYCMDIELARAIRRADAGEVILIPIIARPCDWKAGPFARFQVLPSGGVPVSSYRPRDRAWADVVAGIRKAISASMLSKDESGSTGSEVTAPALGDLAVKIQQDAERMHRREREGHAVFARHLPHFFEQVEDAARSVRASAPSLSLELECRVFTCLLRTTNASLYLEAQAELRIVLELAFGPNTAWWRRFLRIPRRTARRTHAIEAWYLELASDDTTWHWRELHSGTVVALDQLPSRLVSRLLELHAAVVRGEQVSSVPEKRAQWRTRP